MKIGCWNYYESLNNNNYMFLNRNAPIGDNLLQPLNELYVYAKQKGVELLTLDMISDFSAIDAFVFFDFPNLKNPLVQNVFKYSTPQYLVLWESEVIRTDNWDKNNHRFFKKIFTWNDAFVDNKTYYKLNVPQSFPVEVYKDLAGKNKFCVLMASNKNAKHPLELYSKRVDAMHWFDKNHPEKFDLYGVGWDGYKFINRKLSKKINNSVPLLSKILSPRYPSYRGQVAVKRSVLEKYKFSICYENARDIPGYITEKIFDCFFAGCVPVYWGANNIADHIPAACYIDKREFETYDALYEFMSQMSDESYVGYLDAIEHFLKSDLAYRFTSDFFSKTLIREMVDEF